MLHTVVLLRSLHSVSFDPDYFSYQSSLKGFCMRNWGIQYAAQNRHDISLIENPYVAYLIIFVITRAWQVAYRPFT